MRTGSTGSDDRSYGGAAGEAFAAKADRPGLNALHDRPAVLDLIGPVSGQRIVDLGCGAGHYAAALVGAGASVVGVEGSESLAAHARARLAGSDGSSVVRHNLEEPMHFLEDESMDGALCALVLHHISRRADFLAEVRRVLRPGGWLVVSSTHPTADWGRFGGSYFEERWIRRQIGSQPEETIEYQHMTTSTIVNELLAAGFTLERMVEPTPLPALKDLDPKKYEELSAAPVFLALRLHK
ncbi:class I SAM-dependent methyltransferase [Promicromonospora sp. NPDC057488]|uniref:class I SAM-dependent methyltransferase n=1 Tax=Promicromonospora sp. NPDC057488 TaxID=3346147 RepID=UPI00366CE98E